MKTHTPGPIDPSKETYITLDEWNKLQETYIFDVNLTVDGVWASTGHDSTTFDVTLGGSKVADDKKDYYNASVPVNTAYTVNDIKVKGCFKLAGNSTISGKVTDTTSVVIPIVTNHSFDGGKVTTAATCKSDGVKTFTCTACGATKTEKIAKTGSHTWDAGKITKPATCGAEGEMTYTCTVCGETKTEKITDNFTYTPWTTEKPAEGSGTVETRVESRKKTKSTKTSESSSLSGWNKVGEKWIESGSGTVDYVESWPSGFDTNSSIYKKYNNSVSASETATAKRTLGSPSNVAYIYWHWSYPISGSHSEANRFIGTYYNEYIKGCGNATIFEAFENGSALSLDSAAGVYKATGHSTYSYWWLGGGSSKTDQLPVKRVKYTDYTKQYTFEQWSDWSDWQEGEIKSDANTEVETRTVYRVKTNNDASVHSWDNGVVTTPATADAPGVKTYTCSVCGTTKTEEIPPQTDTPVTPEPVDPGPSDPTDPVDPTVTHIPGDINGDKVVNNKDLTRLMKYLAGENVEVVNDALDVNGDKSVNNKDLTRLMKYLAGAEVAIF